MVLDWTIYVTDKFYFIFKWSRLVVPLKSLTKNSMATAIGQLQVDSSGIQISGIWKFTVLDLNILCNILSLYNIEIVIQ